jgi:hypothetical protein
MITPRLLAPWVSTNALHGDWWPRTDPTLHYPGVLNIADAVSHLTVTAPPIGQEVFAMGQALTIHGAVGGASGQQPVTLWDRAQSFLKHETNGTDHTRRFTHVILGAHLDDYSSAKFECSAVSFHDLDVWSRFRRVIPGTTPEEDLPLHTIGTLWTPYADLFDAAYTVRVHLEYPGRDARVVFVTAPAAPALLHELLLRDFQALLTFCYQSGAPILGEWIGTAPSGLYPVLREDSYRQGPVGHLAQSQMILTLGEVPFGQLVENWWAVLEDNFPAPQVLTTYHHLNRGLLEQSTASVLAATENMHLQVGPSQERFPPETLARNKKVIKDAFPDQESALFRTFLYEKFSENRPTLDTKLSELVDIVTRERMTTLGVEPGGWMQLFKKVRNKLAHTGAHVPRRGDSGEDLDRINAQARAFLAVLLLTRLGLDEDAVDRAASTLSKYPHRSW